MADRLGALVREYQSEQVGRREFIKRCVALGISLTAAANLAAACAPATTPSAAPGASSTAKSGGQFVFVDGTDAVTLDPHASPDVGYSFNLIRAPAEALVEYVVKPDGSTDVGPRLAKSWKTTDSVVWDFELNQGIKFHDGTPFNAAAAKANFDRILALKLGPAGRLGAVSRVEAVGDNALRITLPGPNANFIWPMTQMLMISPTALQANAGSDNGQKWAAENVVGTGPFLISSRTKGSETIMKRFDGYWRGWTGNHVDSVVVKVAKEATTRRLMLERGEAQVANNIAVTDLAPLESNKDIAVSHVQGPGVQMAAARFRGPLKDVNVRQAITYAFDAEGFIKGAMQGRGDLARGLVYTEFRFFNKDIPSIKQDLAKAKSFLSKSATPNGGFELTLLILPGFAPYQTDMAQVWQENLKQLNIKLNIQPMTDVNVYYASVEDEQRGADLWAWNGAAQTPDHNFQARRQWHTDFKRPRGVNGGYTNPRLDALLDKDLATVDDNGKRQIWEEVQKILFDDMPFIPFFIPLNYWVSRKGVAGVPQNRFDLVPNYYNIYFTS